MISAIVLFKGEHNTVGVHLADDGDPSSVFSALYDTCSAVEPWPMFDYASWAGAFIQKNRKFVTVRNAYSLRLIGSCENIKADSVLRLPHLYWYEVYFRGDKTYDTVVDVRTDWNQVRGVHVWPDKQLHLRRYILANKNFPNGKPPSAKLLQPVTTRKRAVTLS